MLLSNGKQLVIIPDFGHFLHFKKILDKKMELKSSIFQSVLDYTEREINSFMISLVPA